jgi:ribonuclease BN (tRNA processing enzyme)
MRLRVLGCSGGIGGRHLRTTSFLVDNDVLIDAGSGVGDLSLAELTRIDHIFVTHSHLDHVTSIPFLVDTVGGMRNQPITVYATAPTIEILKNHLFNWAIWTQVHRAAGDPRRACRWLPSGLRRGEPGIHRRHGPER